MARSVTKHSLEAGQSLCQSLEQQRPQRVLPPRSRPAPSTSRRPTPFFFFLSRGDTSSLNFLSRRSPGQSPESSLRSFTERSSVGNFECSRVHRPRRFDRFFLSFSFLFSFSSSCKSMKEDQGRVSFEKSRRRGNGWKRHAGQFNTAERYPGEKMARMKQDLGRDKGTFNYRTRKTLRPPRGCIIRIPAGRKRGDRPARRIYVYAHREWSINNNFDGESVREGPPHSTLYPKR